DISFSGNLPGDQYVPVLKTVAQEFKRRNISTPIVGGLIASFDDGFMNCICDNGVLDACDIFSFHTYCRAPQMEDVSMRYLKWLERNHAEWKPVWITECGRPWSKGTSRPNREADLESAIDIVQKGVAAKAMGIDAYFPFVYVFYEENDNNFGMSDRNNAPLRSIAGYARSIYLLSGSRCVGSWDVEGAERSYLFVDNDTKEQVAVLYASSRQNGRTVQLPATPSFVERVTGERLTVSPDNVVDFSDGFLFVSYPSDAELVLKESAEVDAARRLRLAANIKHGPDPRRNFSTAVRFDYDPEILTANRAGYLIKDSNAERLEGRISVYNFDATAKTLTDGNWTLKAEPKAKDGTDLVVTACEAGSGVLNFTNVKSDTGFRVVSIRGCGDRDIVELVAPDVTEIGTFGFVFCKTIRKVTLSPDFESFGFRCFEGATNLVSVTPTTFPKVVKLEKGNHFLGCTALTGDFSFPNLETGLSGRMFANSGITSVRLPKSGEIGWNSLSGCGNLRYVEFAVGRGYSNEAARAEHRMKALKTAGALRDIGVPRKKPESF
ncbi:MAG: leucine-rich repeat domain-containing protein, partial [Thermoguttaceae bacterium]|nr:leucine-rich repeat domain-containing protein [Thermoguttaceae bacterium]